MDDNTVSHTISTPRSTTPTVRSRRSSGGLTPLPSETSYSVLETSQMLHSGISQLPFTLENSICITEDENKANDASDPLISQKINSGMKKIQELDEILKLKSKIAQDLQNNRIKKEETPNSLEETTEATHMHSRPKVGRDQLFQKTVNSVYPTPIAYDTGDFVQRNIVLGKDARYYHAMSQVECIRVENILENSEFDVESFDNFENASSIDRPQSSLTGFYPDPLDLNRLLEIDKELQKIVPESDWETKSLVWSSAMPSGTTTPLSSIRSPNVVDSVLESLTFELSLNHERLKEIDQRLNELQNSIIPDDIKLDPKQLEFLITSTILEEKQYLN